MASVLHLVRTLELSPVLAVVTGIHVRSFLGGRDVQDWLDLRRQAFDGADVKIRSWTEADFVAEFLRKPWWRADRMWFAESVGADTHQAPQVVGTVTLAMRGDAATGLPVVHWLAVLPEFRRRGIGQLLMAVAETACWNAGHRRIGLETHAAWKPAMRLYESSGRPTKATIRGPWPLGSAHGTNVLEEGAKPLKGAGGAIDVKLEAYEIATVGATVDVKPAVRGGARGAKPDLAPRAEPAQPVFADYWLHNKGAAPVGYQAVSVGIRPSILSGDGPFSRASSHSRALSCCGNEAA